MAGVHGPGNGGIPIISWEISKLCFLGFIFFWKMVVPSIFFPTLEEKCKPEKPRIFREIPEKSREISWVEDHPTFFGFYYFFGGIIQLFLGFKGELTQEIKKIAGRIQETKKFPG